MTCTGVEYARTEELKTRWYRERELLTREQGHATGIALITEVLGLSEEIAERFARRDHSVYDAVGMRQAGIDRPDRVCDFRNFWQKVSLIAPNLCPEDSIEFLSERGGAMATIVLAIALQEVSGAPILLDLAGNAHAYK